MAMFLGNRPAGGHILHYSRLGYLGLFAVCGREDARPTSLFIISERYLVCGPGGRLPSPGSRLFRYRLSGPGASI